MVRIRLLWSTPSCVTVVPSYTLVRLGGASKDVSVSTCKVFATILLVFRWLNISTQPLTHLRILWFVALSGAAATTLAASSRKCV